MSHKSWVCKRPAACACCLEVCVNGRAGWEVFIYRNTWVHFRVVDYLAEDSTAHVLFSWIHLCCFKKSFLLLLCNLCKFVAIKRRQRRRSVKGGAAFSRSRWNRVVLVVAASLQILFVLEVCRDPDSSWIPACVPLMCITRHSWYLLKWALWDRMSLIFSWSIFKISHHQWASVVEEVFFNGKLFLRLTILYILAVMVFFSNFCVPKMPSGMWNKHE